MSLPGVLQVAAYLAILLLLTKPIGIYMARVYGGESTLLSPILQPVEGLIYRVIGVDPAVEHHWTIYTAAMVLFNLVGLLFVYALERLQAILPLNPQGLGSVNPDLAL